MDFIVSEKEGPYGKLVIVTDANILGKIFEQNRLQLDLRKKFYQGTKKIKREVVGLLNGAQHIQLTGKASVALGIELDLVDETKIIYVDKVPHAEIVFG